jgi:hypothetical protein
LVGWVSLLVWLCLVGRILLIRLILRLRMGCVIARSRRWWRIAGIDRLLPQCWDGGDKDKSGKKRATSHSPYENSESSAKLRVFTRPRNFLPPQQGILPDQRPYPKRLLNVGAYST